MRKLIYILLFIPFVLTAQDLSHIGYGINSRDRSRINAAIDQINENNDTLTVLRTDINTNITNISIHDDSLTAIRSDVNTNITDIATVDSRVDSSKVVFNYETSSIVGFVTADSMTVDFINVGAIRYTNIYYDDLRVPLTNTRINPTKSEPIFEDIGDGTLAWGFDANADSTEGNHFIAQTPHGWNLTDLDAHLHWTVPDANAGNVVWILVYNIASVDGAFAATDTFRVVAAAPGIAYNHTLTDLGDIDCSLMTGASVILKGNVARSGEADDDTYGSSAYGLEIDFHYQFDRPGSEEEYERY